MKTFFDLGKRTLADRPAEQVVADTLRVRETLEQLVRHVRHSGRQHGPTCDVIAHVTARRLQRRLSLNALAAAAARVVVVAAAVVVKRHYCVAVTSQMTSTSLSSQLHTLQVCRVRQSRTCYASMTTTHALFRLNTSLCLLFICCACVQLYIISIV